MPALYASTIFPIHGNETAEDFLPKIKQAFAEEQPTIVIHDNAPGVMTNLRTGEKTMTGQAFYDRFEKEMINDPHSFIEWQREPYEMAYEAARRAAGLD